MPALELKLFIVNEQLVGLKTGKVRCFIVIDKKTLTQVQTIKLGERRHQGGFIVTSVICNVLILIEIHEYG